MSLIGATVANHRILSVLGRGGYGTVFLAEHCTIGRRAAIKVLSPALAADPQMVERLFREARAANQIHHSGIVEIYDCGQSPDLGAYLIMEHLEGETLGARLERKQKLPPDELAVIVEQVADALQKAHAASIVHRDLKPDNIFLVGDPQSSAPPRVKLLDFGMAKLRDGIGPETLTDVVAGTPLYMSPEQFASLKNVDHRTDVYALGVICYQALCGRPPFADQAPIQLMQLHLHQAPPPLRSLDPRIPPDLEDSVFRALAKDPAERFQNMSELSLALSRSCRPPEPCATLPPWNTLGDAAGVEAPVHARGAALEALATSSRSDASPSGASSSPPEAGPVPEAPLAEAAAKQTVAAPDLAPASEVSPVGDHRAAPEPFAPSVRSSPAVAVPHSSSSRALVVSAVVLLGLGGVGIYLATRPLQPAPPAGSAHSPAPAEGASIPAGASTRTEGPSSPDGRGPAPAAPAPSLATKPPVAAAPASPPLDAPADSWAARAQPVRHGPRVSRATKRPGPARPKEETVPTSPTAVIARTPGNTAEPRPDGRPPPSRPKVTRPEKKTGNEQPELRYNGDEL
jgi:serine/threonine-protein kinase